MAKTVAVMWYYGIFFMPIFYGIFSLSFFRSRYWEIFYTTHLYASIVFIVLAFWHATQGWRFLMPAVVLYFIDRCLRFYNSTRIAYITDVDTFSADNFSVSKLQFTEASAKLNEFRMGQFYYINIPCISQIEWHPFTISCAQSARLPTLHIKVSVVFLFN